MINDYLRERITRNMFSHFRVMFAKLRFPSFKKDITRSCHLAISEEPFQETRSAFRRALQWTRRQRQTVGTLNVLRRQMASSSDIQLFLYIYINIIKLKWFSFESDNLEVYYNDFRFIFALEILFIVAEKSEKKQRAVI